MSLRHPNSGSCGLVSWQWRFVTGAVELGNARLYTGVPLSISSGVCLRLRAGIAA
jgi:hypothetical protein